MNADDYLRSSASNNEHDNDDDEGEVTECGPEKLTRAQRKRLRKKKLKEDARRRRNIIGPLLPTTSDGDNNGRGGGGEINSPDVRQNADEKCATPSVESGEIVELKMASLFFKDTIQLTFFSFLLFCLKESLVVAVIRRS